MKDKWCLKRYGQSDQNLFIYNNTPSQKKPPKNVFPSDIEWTVGAKSKS